MIERKNKTGREWNPMPYENRHEYPKLLGYVNRIYNGRMLDWCLYEPSESDKIFLKDYLMPNGWTIYKSRSDKHFGFIALSKKGTVIKFLEDHVWDHTDYDFKWGDSVITKLVIIYND